LFIPLFNLKISLFIIRLALLLILFRLMNFLKLLIKEISVKLWFNLYVRTKFVRHILFHFFYSILDFHSVDIINLSDDVLK
jgi:hypothetical protein